LHFFIFMLSRALSSTLFPYTTLFRSGAVADERGAFDRVGHLAVLDQVRLGGREHELAVGDVDLAAAEIRGVEAFLHAADDLLRVDRKSTRLNSSHGSNSYAVFCLNKK